MSWILKLFGGSKITAVLAITIGALLLSTAAATRAYLSTRDKLAVANVQSSALAKQLSKQIELAAAAEQARIDLQGEVEALESQGKEIVTKIETKWKDRVVREAYPVAVECSSVSLPPDILRLLKCARGGCAVPEDAL